MNNSSAGSAARILTTLRNSLLALHKTLLDSERAVYERDVARIESPGHLFGLVMNDPWFAYLRELSRFVVAIDELLDAEEPASMYDADRFLRRARDLLKPSETGQGFDRRYFEALQRDPNVVLAHAETTRTLSQLSPQ